jgi:hypothetical protein
MTLTTRAFAAWLGLSHPTGSNSAVSAKLCLRLCWLRSYFGREQACEGDCNDGQDDLSVSINQASLLIEKYAPATRLMGGAMQYIGDLRAGAPVEMSAWLESCHEAVRGRNGSKADIRIARRTIRRPRPDLESIFLGSAGVMY